MAVEEMIWEFFRIDPMYVSGVFLNDIVNLIILPSVVLILFLDFAASLFMRGSHQKWKLLLSLVFYLVIVLQGFYAPFAVFASSFAVLFLFLAFGLFFFTRFITKSEVGAIASVASSTIAKKKLCQDRRNEERYLISEINRLNHEIAAARAQQNAIKESTLMQELSTIQKRLNEVRYDIARLKCS